MEIKVSQIVPGCILTKDIMGKTNDPIISKDTVLTNEHIVILKKFLIDKVKVSKAPIDRKEQRAKVSEESTNDQQTKVNNNKKSLFSEYYQQAVMKYKEHFKQWQNNIPINIPEIRKFLVPLIESSMDIEIEVYKLYQYVSKEDYIYQQSISVGILSSFLARKMGYEKGESIQIGLAGFLCNVGMAKIDPNIISKAGSLTHAERQEVEKHSTYSYIFIKPVQIITDTIKLAVLQHHERLDGSGYPFGLLGDKIHQYARIIAICDIYHAMTSDRPYQSSQSPFTVMNELKKNHFTKLDSLAVRTFIQSFINLSLGESVKLSNNQIGKITFIDNENLMAPLILLEDSGEVISLENDRTLSIIDFI